MRKLSSAILVLMTASCVNTELSTGDSYNTNSQARIRLFGQNGRPTTMKVEINGKQEEINVGGSMGQAAASLFGAKSNESIGMPESIYSKDPSQFSNIGSGAFFKEFVIPAGKDVIVTNSIQTPPHTYTDVAAGKTITTYKTCSGNEITFVAKAGKDYEVIPAPSTNECGVTLNELNQL